MCLPLEILIFTTSKVQGNIINDGLVEVWITRSTAKFLEAKIGSLSTEELSNKILEYNYFKVEEDMDSYAKASDLAIPIFISVQAYEHLKKSIEYVSDEQLIQVFAQNTGKK